MRPSSCTAVSEKTRVTIMERAGERVTHRPTYVDIRLPASMSPPSSPDKPTRRASSGDRRAKQRHSCGLPRNLSFWACIVVFWAFTCLLFTAVPVDRRRAIISESRDDAWRERLSLVTAGIWDTVSSLKDAAAGNFLGRDARKCASVGTRGVLGYPMYAYRDAMADRTPSNVRDIARRAAEDRRDSKHHERADSVTNTAVRKSPRPPGSPASLVRVVSTHHKTGTALMRDVFSHIASDPRWAAKYGPFADIRQMEDHPGEGEKSWVKSREAAAKANVVLDYHLGKQLPEFMIARGPEDNGDEGVEGNGEDGEGGEGEDGEGEGNNSVPRECSSLVSTFPDYRAVHVVRDPTQVLISGYLYHRRLPEDETWLFEPSVELGGGTYAERLVRAEGAGPGDAMLAEISMADDELRMLALAYRDVERDPRGMNVKLEDFFKDFDRTMGKVLRFLEFDEGDVGEMVKLAGEFDVGRWSREELAANEHFTQSEDRSPYVRAIERDHFLNATVSYMRYAMGYVDEFPIFE